MRMHFPISQAGPMSRLGALQQWTRRDVRDGASLGSWLRRAALAMTGVLALWVVGAAAAERWRIASAELDVLPPQTVHVEHRPCVTAPFFDTTAFQNVAPGMTEAEVRDRLGYPLTRTKPAEERVFWHYTLPVETGTAYTSFSVVFDLTSRRVARTNVMAVAAGENDGEVWTLRANENGAQFEVLTCFSRNTLQSGGNAVVLVVPDAAASARLTEAMRQRLIRLRLSDVPVLSCVFRLGETFPWERQGMGAAAGEEVLCPHEPQVVVVASDGIYALPRADLPCFRSACEADVDWVLVRLLGGAKAAKPALDTAN